MIRIQKKNKDEDEDEFDFNKVVDGWLNEPSDEDELEAWDEDEDGW